ncbi:MAG TPA: hypothetical protein VH816_03550 [Gaiellaceae bacterium]|jgi:hypothetical protein
MSDPVSELKRELLAAAERGYGPSRESHRLRNRLLLVAATLVIAAAALLLSTTPWSSSPTFVERAEAALTPPAGTILHQKWVVTTTSVAYGCTVRHRPNESWLDQKPPHLYRIVLNVPPPPSTSRLALACGNPKGPELGGTLDSATTLEFTPPNTLLTRSRIGLPIDPVADLRQRLAAGTAHKRRRTTWQGRVVEWIKIDPEPGCGSQGCPWQPFWWFVDPKTLEPVGMMGIGGISEPGRRLLRLRVVVHFLEYEYLPRTPENVALTDIRAQHPDATTP